MTSGFEQLPRESKEEDLSNFTGHDGKEREINQDGRAPINTKVHR